MMNDFQFDKEFAELLQTSEFVLPDSYETRFQETLKQISVMNPKRYFLLFHSKIAAVITICLVSISVSVGVGAAINLYQQRMSTMNREQICKYNSDVQNVEAEVDGFSRSLSQEEQDRMTNLREQYEKSGRFPTNEILEVQKESAVIRDTLCFCTENSTFYLPKTTLTDEELLQIIDFMEKRDYSVQRENTQEEPDSQGEYVTEDAAVEQAKQMITEIYQVEATEVKASVELDVTKNSAGDKLSSYFVALTDKGWRFDAVVEIDSQTGKINGVDVESKDKKECVPGLKVKPSKYATVESEIKRISGILGLHEEIENIWMSYNYLADNTLNRGNVKYVIEAKEGDGYVFLYSVNTGMLYDMYYIPDYTVFMKQEKRNAKQNEKGGIYRKQVMLR